MLKYPLFFLFVSSALVAWFIFYAYLLLSIYGAVLAGWFGEFGDNSMTFWYESLFVLQITSILLTLAFWPITKLFKLGPNIFQETGKSFKAFGIYFLFGISIYWLDHLFLGLLEPGQNLLDALIEHKVDEVAIEVWSGSIVFTLVAFALWKSIKFVLGHKDFLINYLKFLIWKEKYAIAGFTVFIVFGLIISGEYSFFELIFMVALVSPLLGIFMGIYTMWLVRVAWAIMAGLIGGVNESAKVTNVTKGFARLKEDPTELEVPKDKTQEEINTGIVKRSDGIFLRDDLFCAWCGSHDIVLQSSELGEKVFEYRNQDGSRDKRVSDNTYQQSFRGIWQCPNCGAKTKTWSFLSDRPSKKTTIRNSLLFKDGLGERLAEDYEDNSGTTVSGANRKSDS